MLMACSRLGFAILCAVGPVEVVAAATIDATPSNYRAMLKSLIPGDTLKLAPGQYPRLFLSGLNGTPDAWITITGTSSEETVIVGEQQHNTIEIENSSYLSIENLRIDSLGIPGAFGISARGHEDNLTHHIRIEGNVLVGQNGGQQTDGISTKTPTWGWIIRFNQILGAGTGMYFGDSDGTQPFVNAIIESNLIADTIGYNIEIKDQLALPAIGGMPLEPTSTIIRNNVFIKNDVPSPYGNRPNLLVGAFPVNGSGSLNTYEIYGNVFLHNHREALFQGSGRISLHDNIFVDGPYDYPAVVLRKQNFELKFANVYNNTIYTKGKGIHFGTRASLGDVVTGNLVLAAQAITGMVTNQSDNLTDNIENAYRYVKSPSFQIESIDLHPLAAACAGGPINLSWFRNEADYALDFDGAGKPRSKGLAQCRGAYSGEIDDDQWKLARALKPPRPPSPAPAPAILWVEPRQVAPGGKVTVELSGTDFEPDATIAISGEGVSASDVVVVNERLMKATITATRGASGIHELTVITGSRKSNSALLQTKAGSVK
jgi:hypothetical protein